MTGPAADVTDNYVQLMRERGWSWDDLADDFLRQAESPSLDRGQNALAMARWARSNADAAKARRDAADDPTEADPLPAVADPDPAKRTATPPRLPRRG